MRSKASLATILVSALAFSGVTAPVFAKPNSFPGEHSTLKQLTPEELAQRRAERAKRAEERKKRREERRLNRKSKTK